jgi:hypothetical protein
MQSLHKSNVPTAAAAGGAGDAPAAEVG